MSRSDPISQLSELYKSLSIGKAPPTGAFDDLLSKVIGLRYVQVNRSFDCPNTDLSMEESQEDACEPPSKKCKGITITLSDAKRPRRIEKIKDEILTKYFGVQCSRIFGDTHSLPKALALGQIKDTLHHTKSDAKKRELTQIIDNLTRADISLETRERSQLVLAKKLLAEAKMPTYQEQHDREDLAKLCAHLSDYQVHLWEGDTPTKRMIFNPDAKKFIGLFLQDNHYEVVTSTKVPRHCSFCHKCGKFENEHNHWKKCDAGTYRESHPKRPEFFKQIPKASKVVLLAPMVYGIKTTDKHGFHSYSIKTADKTNINDVSIKKALCDFIVNEEQLD